MELKLCSDMAWVPKRRDGLIRLGAVHAIFESVFKYSASMTVVLVLVFSYGTVVKIARAKATTS